MHTRCTRVKVYLTFLGFHISEKALNLCVIKLKTFKIFQDPQTIKQLSKFLGLDNFYGRFTPKDSHILIPLIRFLEGFTNNKKHKHIFKLPEHPLRWNDKALAAFTAAKEHLLMPLC
ncbi:hypothetical protein CEXT_564231 [Caerostris extrusa]|uniref:Uncharacterized protein n=1 Tax=Caerostris extrusa TaxID=172846 RepID=A0AAV4WV88_CAEEX|nr:hypothetical protein CEXT_564231 [Caerostris extrusa]